MGTAERDDEVARSKQTLRRLARQRRRARSPDAVRAADSLRTQAIMGRIGALTSATTVAAYWSASGEPDTHQVVNQLHEMGHRVLLPVVSGGRDHPDWGWFDGEQRLIGTGSGLAEPDGQPLSAAALAEATLVICPGLVGGRDGSRLGTGGGWYDRALVHLSPQVPRWLLLFADEVIDAVPALSHDVHVSDLVTEAEWVQCQEAVS